MKVVTRGEAAEDAGEPIEPGRPDGLDYQLLRRMAHSPIYNYAIPGLTSWLIGAPTEQGCVRLFECNRDHHESITPHSHRFDFDCIVLEGEVMNITWRQSNMDFIGDEYVVSEQIYLGAPGSYEIVTGTPSRWSYSVDHHGQGECYGMKADAVHSIRFSKGARVLFFEGPKVSDRSVFLEPFCNGLRVPTFETRHWMFRRGT